MKLEEITPETQLSGVIPGVVVKVIAANLVGSDSLTLVYKGPDNNLVQRQLFRSDEGDIQIAQFGRAWAMDGNASDFKLGAEAYRIHLAHLFDPLMAIHSSNVVPLPHQITAVYEAMLPRRPLRFVLADDPGAGKTIMAGLLIRELMVRGDLERCLVVAPGSLADQWQDELHNKFNLHFDIFSRTALEESVLANPFLEKNLLICRVDQLSRADDLKEKFKASQWDLIIVDEAHKLSATYFGSEMKKTLRYQLGELLGSKCRHFLLMTATPHNGKEEDFQAFMALLDSDRFYGRFRDGAHQVNTKDLMRRMVKEELYKFDGTRLFPERIAETVNYPLSKGEAALYAAVTNYVSEEMNRAQELDGKRKGTVGFALTILQRRLASSPEAILKSLERRTNKLDGMLREARVMHKGLSALGNLFPSDLSEDEADDAYEDVSSDKIEDLENKVVDQATAAQTVKELENEISVLKGLVEKARSVRLANEDHKWNELSKLLRDNPWMIDPQGNRRKIILFTEHKDTLNYLYDRILGILGRAEAIVLIHGGIRREERKKAIEKFTHYADCVVLLATDAAGEGVNLQCAHLMVNYDLPWNPNRLEQRFGRIHRIGQTEICRLWNLVSNETMEGQVFHRLFEKLEQERKSLGGKVFDILGRVFEQKTLKNLLMEAILYGDSPETRAKSLETVDCALEHSRLIALVEQDALGCDLMSPTQVYKLKADMEKAEALRLQPYFIHAFFNEAFHRLGGDLKRRELGRFEITRVPPSILQRDRAIGSKTPVVEKYHRVCFEKNFHHLPGKPPAALIGPGHPLMDATVDLMRERFLGLLKQGTILLNPADLSQTPKLLFFIDHAVCEGLPNSLAGERTVSRKIHFVLMDPSGAAVSGGPAPYLDYDALPDAFLPKAQEILAQPWLKKDLEQNAIHYALEYLVPSHYHEARTRRINLAEDRLKAVHARLTQEIQYWTHRYETLLIEAAAGRQPRVQPDNAKQTANNLTARLQYRTAELIAQKHITSKPPYIVGGALILPAGLFANPFDPTPVQEDGLSTDPLARKKMEQIGMETVMAAERALGFAPQDVSAQNLGWDITSTDPLGNCRFLEVKARQIGASCIHVTKNEMLVGFNRKNQGWFLVLVLVENDTPEAPLYIPSPFDREPGWAECGVVLNVAALIQKALPTQTPK